MTFQNNINLDDQDRSSFLPTINYSKSTLTSSHRKLYSAKHQHINYVITSTNSSVTLSHISELSVLSPGDQLPMQGGINAIKEKEENTYNKILKNLITRLGFFSTDYLRIINENSTKCRDFLHCSIRFPFYIF